MNCGIDKYKLAATFGGSGFGLDRPIREAASNACTWLCGRSDDEFMLCRGPSPIALIPDGQCFRVPKILYKYISRSRYAHRTQEDKRRTDSVYFMTMSILVVVLPLRHKIMVFVE